MTIKINETGRNAIQMFLLEKSAPNPQLGNRLQALIKSAGESSSGVIFLEGNETSSGTREFFRIPHDGFDLLMTLEEFHIFTEKSHWNSVNNATWEYSIGPTQEVNYDIDEDDVVYKSGFNRIWRESTTQHTSGKPVTVIYTQDEMWDPKTIDTENRKATSAGTWQIEGVTIINVNGLPCSYQTIHKFFESRNGRFGYKDETYTANLKFTDRLSLLPHNKGAVKLSGEIEEVSVEVKDVTYSWDALVIASVSNQYEVTDLWEECSLKLSSCGTYMCEREYTCATTGDPVRHTGGLLKSKAAVISFFGQGRLAKEIYKQAGF